MRRERRRRRDARPNRARRDGAVNPPTVVAFSGGGDSTALLHRMLEAGGPVLALVVDHAQREGSARDAARAAAMAHDAGAESEILTLREGLSGHARLRDARFAALAQAALRRGATSVLFAHTMDDQAETVVLRLARGSSWRGLAGMAERSPWPIWPSGRPLEVIRPLLGLRRAPLRAEVRSRGATWIDDPANVMTRFARVRARALLAELDRVEAFAALATRAQGLAATLDAAARRLAAETFRFEQGGIAITPEGYRAAPETVRRRALAAALTAAGGGRREPEAELVARLDRALADPALVSFTAAGVMARAKRDMFRLRRDPGAALRRGPSALRPTPIEETGFVWDRRLALTAREPGWRVEAAGRGSRADPTEPRLIDPQGGVWRLGEGPAGEAIDASWLLEERVGTCLWR